jgi:signal transduction histidine kinase
MAEEFPFAQARALSPAPISRELRFALYFGFAALLASLLAALFIPEGFALNAFGDSLQVLLVGAAALFAFRNFLRSHSRARIFWFLISAGALQWTISNAIWATYEVVLARPVPDLPLVDILLFLKVVPFTAAIAIAPDRENVAQFRVFGLLDVFVLMVYALYLFVFGVLAYRLLPGAQASYNFYFNLADALSNQTLVIATGIAVLSARNHWRALYRFYFFAAVCYGLASNFINVSIDLGHYYTGSLYDVPLIASLAAFLCFTLAGRTPDQEQLPESAPNLTDASLRPATFLSEHLAMLVALSTPVIGIWLLFSNSTPPQLRTFRLAITLLTILVLTLLLSVKQDILATGLFQSLQRLSENYRSIERFKNHLTQSEKLASLGELVAEVAKQIKLCMASILEAASRITSKPGADFGVQNMAGKIAQYAQRTDGLVDNMLHFAQETPMRLAPMDIKPLLESALHLSRIAKLPAVRVELSQEGDCAQVHADSGQLLHVFLELISNTMDALQEAGGGTFDIKLRSSGSQLLIEFADSGPGLKEPQRVFEPFYTTKQVGKGTGLGLSTCYGIIQQHDGDISCRNRPEGGAIFTIRIPFALATAAETTHEAGNLLAEGVS